MRYSDAKVWLEERFGDFGYPAYQEPTVHPGPTSATQLVNAEPGAMVFVTVGGGAGLTTEALYDRPFLVVRVLGEQEDYDGAEKLAADIDNALLAISSPTMMGEQRVLYANRTGSGPSLLDYDGRYSFQCSYVVEASRVITTEPVVLPGAPTPPVVAVPDDALVWHDTAATWVVPHTFGRVPAVDVYLANGEQIDPDVTATSTMVTIMFPSPTTGLAVLT